MKKNNTTEQILEKIYNYSLEEIMGERFGRYSKYIIQDRAIPDVRDGLKPVQRRILYAMYIGHNTYDKPYRKSAKTVGDVIGSFHPHGDTSIYGSLLVPVPPVICTDDVRYKTGLRANWGGSTKPSNMTKTEPPLTR